MTRQFTKDFRFRAKLRASPVKAFHFLARTLWAGPRSDQSQVGKFRSKIFVDLFNPRWIDSQNPISFALRYILSEFGY